MPTVISFSTPDATSEIKFKNRIDAENYFHNYVDSFGHDSDYIVYVHTLAHYAYISEVGTPFFIEMEIL